jgi:hypothetical protein
MLNAKHFTGSVIPANTGVVRVFFTVEQGNDFR